MRVLVTRPKEGAEDSAKILRARGHVVLTASLIEIRFLDGSDISFDGVQAILATSSNGVHALARRAERRDIPLFAVGAQTARAARDAGFTIVRSADGDARSLADALLDWAMPNTGALLHAAGAETKGQLAETLLARGFDVRTEVLYDAIAAPELPAEALLALEAGELDAVLLFSPRSARIFADCVVKASAAEKCATLSAFCISEAAVKGLAPLVFRALHVATRPDQETLLALLG